MYYDTITLFTQHNGTWKPAVLRGVDLNTDRGRIVATYGEKSTDRAILHIKFREQDGHTYVGDYEYFEPEDYTGEGITMKTGEDFSFFMRGEWTDGDVEDDDYIDGFYNYISVVRPSFKINSVAKYSVIPHFEVLGR